MTATRILILVYCIWSYLEIYMIQISATVAWLFSCCTQICNIAIITVIISHPCNFFLPNLLLNSISKTEVSKFFLVAACPHASNCVLKFCSVLHTFPCIKAPKMSITSLYDMPIMFLLIAPCS